MMNIKNNNHTTTNSNQCSKNIQNSKLLNTDDTQYMEMSVPYSDITSTSHENSQRLESISKSVDLKFFQSSKNNFQSNLQALKKIPRNINKNSNIKIQCKTEFPLVRSVAQGQFGWSLLSRQDHKQLIDIIWQDGYVTQELVNRLRPYQKVNHFPYSANMGRKDFLFTNLNRMNKKFPEFYNYYPKTWIFPEDYETFKNKQDLPDENKYYIVKPVSSCQGKGIYLSKKQQILRQSGNKLLVQQYMENPLLIDGLKFDLRIYVLIKSLKPLKIYIYREGLTRLATNQYEKPDPNNYKNGRMHLTNYAINKTNPEFIHNNDFRKDNIGHKRSLNSFFLQLQKLGHDPEIIRQKIHDIIIKTILSVYQKMTSTQKVSKYEKQGLLKESNIFNSTFSKQMRCKQSDILEQRQAQKNNEKCFELLGFDIMIQNDFQPKLIEINHQPSLQAGTPLDYVIKKYLLVDLFNLLNLDSVQKSKYLSNSSNSQIIKVKKNLNQVKINKIERGQSGGFEQIYPPINKEKGLLYSKILPNIAWEQGKGKFKAGMSSQQGQLKQELSFFDEKILIRQNIRTTFSNKRKSFNCNYINILASDKRHEQFQKLELNEFNSKGKNFMEFQNSSKTLQPFFSYEGSSSYREHKITNIGNFFSIPKKNLNFTIKYKRNRQTKTKSHSMDEQSPEDQTLSPFPFHGNETFSKFIQKKHSKHKEGSFREPCLENKFVIEKNNLLGERLELKSRTGVFRSKQQISISKQQPSKPIGVSQAGKGCKQHGEYEQHLASRVRALRTMREQRGGLLGVPGSQKNSSEMFRDESLTRGVK